MSGLVQLYSGESVKGDSVNLSVLKWAFPVLAGDIIKATASLQRLGSHSQLAYGKRG